MEILISWVVFSNNSVNKKSLGAYNLLIPFCRFEYATDGSSDEHGDNEFFIKNLNRFVRRCRCRSCRARAATRKSRPTPSRRQAGLTKAAGEDPAANSTPQATTAGAQFYPQCQHPRIRSTRRPGGGREIYQRLRRDGKTSPSG